jgi:xanthine/CO dehydrogenase XdhC/CoxF family maturation factor
MTSQRYSARLDTSLELLAERLAILQTPCVVATVVSSAGSTYRKPGARMLVEGDGRITGLLSGGCFEHDLRDHAAAVLSRDVARTVTYDMRSDNDLIFGIGAGCEGCMQILLEPAHVGGPAAGAIATACEMSQRSESVALVTIYEGPDDMLGTRLWHRHLQAPVDALEIASACVQAVDSRQSQSISWKNATYSGKAWIQVVGPPPAVLICGAGPDAQPLAAGLRALRFPVTMVDHRPAYANALNFPGATVMVGPAASLASRVDLNRFFAAVVMSHHLESDAAYLRVLARTPIDYIGLLGPVLRRERLLDEIGGASVGIERRLRSPVGLDIGAVTPDGIALAIVAEIHAAAAGRAGGSIATARP